MLLAGGVGSRLNVLGAHRAKPAVPFGGIYRIIDFTLSNAMNSGLNTVGLLTQYKPLSLMGHIGTGAPWDFIGRTRVGEKDLATLVAVSAFQSLGHNGFTQKEREANWKKYLGFVPDGTTRPEPENGKEQHKRGRY